MKMGKERAEEENADQYAIENLGSRRYRSNFDPSHTLILNVGRSRSTTSHREFFLHKVHSFHNSIPKHITSFDEKYVLHCLELIRNSALRAAFNYSTKKDILPTDSSSLVENKNRDSHIMAVECPLATGTDVFIGTVSGSQSMINILNSPLLQQFGSFDSALNFRKSLQDVNEHIYSDFSNSPPKLGGATCHELENEVGVLDRRLVSSPTVHRRVVSMSSTNSSCSDQSSSSSSASSFQGMLRCSWKNGMPHHVFSVDDKREVYVANFSKVESLDDKVLDYVYSFHSKKNGKKESFEVHEHELESVGKMRVLTSILLGSDNSEVRETQFILSVCNDNPISETQTPSHTLKKNKRLTRKVVDVFRASHSYKHRSNSKFGGSNAICEDSPWEPSEEVNKGRIDSCVEDKYAPNLEMAAIIVKEACKSHKEDEPGGWGLKFLKKSGKSSYTETLRPSECMQNDGDCSTSLSVVIPAGFHGGPRSRVGGPSSLTERWISGGHCDCGGWDLGCQLTVLNTKSSYADSSIHTQNVGECKSVDLYIQGSKQEVPVMKMVNIHEGLYYIHFQSTLSSLQSFAIATAIFHSRSPVLRSKLYRS